jgi:hypothetical protein
MVWSLQDVEIHLAGQSNKYIEQIPQSYPHDQFHIQTNDQPT